MSGATKSVIHIVDDDDAVRDSLQILLETHGMNVHAYGSADEFLNEVDLRAGGCLVLDLHLPILSGLELLRILRERKIPLPVVFITGGNDRKMKARALEGGAVAFLDKPVVEETLLAAIHDALALGQREGAPCPRKIGLRTTAGHPGSSPS